MTEDEETGPTDGDSDSETVEESEEPEDAEPAEEPEDGEPAEEPEDGEPVEDAERPEEPEDVEAPGESDEPDDSEESGDPEPAADAEPESGSETTEPEGGGTPGGLDSVMEGSESFPDTEPGGPTAGAPGDGDEPLFDDDAFSAESLGMAEPGPEPDSASPFDELESGARGSDDDVDFDQLFEEMFTDAGADEIDAESVWDELEGAGVEDAETSGEEHIVSTRAFCAQCEYAAEPPEVRCTYEGSEIVEFVDKDNVRVRNCPIVEQRRGVSEME